MQALSHCVYSTLIPGLPLTYRYVHLFNLEEGIEEYGLKSTDALGAFSSAVIPYIDVTQDRICIY